MQNSYQNSLRSGKSGQENRHSTLVQTINIMGNTITNENRLQVEKAQFTTHRLQVKNHEIVINQQKLTRITQIQVEDKVIKIMDTFTGASFLEYNKTIISQGRLDSPENSIYQEEYTKSSSSKEEHHTLHMSTVNRNIFKMFKEWVKHNTFSKLELKNSLELICKRKEKCHLNFLAEVEKEPELREAFLIFCSDEGRKIVHQSKIKEKHTYLKVLDNYQKSCQQSFPRKTLLEVKKMSEKEGKFFKQSRNK